ncbi:hypothetical protein D9M71_796080 [compost metagenome]
MKAPAWVEGVHGDSTILPVKLITPWATGVAATQAPFRPNSNPAAIATYFPFMPTLLR